MYICVCMCLLFLYSFLYNTLYNPSPLTHIYYLLSSPLLSFHTQYHDSRSKTFKDVTAKVDINKPKILCLRGPKLHSKVKFELPFLFKVHTGWTASSIKNVPRELRSPKEISLSLEGKTTINLACRGIIEDAKVYLLR